MRAVRFHQYGDDDVLTLDEVPEPEAGPGEVVVRVRSCAVNHLDLDFRTGVSRIPLDLPHTLGMETAGDVVAAGPGVSRFQPGERAMTIADIVCRTCHYCTTGRDNMCTDALRPGWNAPGGYAEYLAVPEYGILPIPASVSYDAAAVLQISCGTAWHMLITRGHLRLGETVVVNAVGSGIGSAALQVAKLAGARVIATAGSDEKLAQAAAEGADATINYRRQDLVSAVRELTDGRGADLIFEHVGGEIFTQSARCIAPSGRMVICGGHAGELAGLDVIDFFRKEATIIGSTSATQEEIRVVLDLVAQGLLRPPIYRAYPLAEARDAHRTMAKRRHYGKIVLHPSA
jgi:NADPH:quinone reductase-like Zn-dependent oxidoreductase